jgi:hypothetical protein
MTTLTAKLFYTMNTFTKMTKSLVALFAITIFTSLSFKALAFDYTWNGSNTNTNWMDKGNWSGGPSTPTTGDSVSIKGGLSWYPVITTGQNITIRAISMDPIGSPSMLTVEGTGSLTVTSTFTIQNVSSIIQTGGTLTVKDFILFSGCTYTQSESTGTAMLNITRDYVNHGGVFTSTAGTINWTGANAAVNAKFAGTNTFYNVSINGTNNPGFNTTSGGAMTVAGNWTNNNAATNMNTSSVTFNGAGTKSIMGSQTTSFNNLTINKTNATDSVIVLKTANVNAALTFVKGVVRTTNAALIAQPSAGTTAGASGSSFIAGPIQKADCSGTGYVFPVGANGILRTATISGASVATDVFTVEYKAEMPTDTAAYNTPLVRVSYVEYWNMSKTGTGTADVKLTWNTNSGVNHNASARVARWNGSSWDELSSTATGTVSSGVVTAVGVSTFNTVTFGSTTFFNTLPVKLISFTAKIVENNGILNWATATEKNNDRFEVERSIDGVNFTVIGTVKGAGNSQNIIKYSYTDKNLAEQGVNTVYYRLHQVDFNGTSEYSAIVTVSTGKLSLTISNAYPNPFQNELNVNYSLPTSGNVTVSLVDMQGKVVASSDEVGKKGSNMVQFNTSDLAKGVYFVNVNYNNANTTYKMLVK